MGAPTLGDILALALQPERTIIERAGRGDSLALRDLATATHNDGVAMPGLAVIAEMGQALSFARLAAVDGTPDDLRAVVFLYGQLAAECRVRGDDVAADHYEAQGYVLAETMAESGDEDMAALVVAAAVDVSPGAHLEAKRLREVLR